MKELHFKISQIIKTRSSSHVRFLKLEMGDFVVGVVLVWSGFVLFLLF